MGWPNHPLGQILGGRPPPKAKVKNKKLGFGPWGWPTHPHLAWGSGAGCGPWGWFGHPQGPKPYFFIFLLLLFSLWPLGVVGHPHFGQGVIRPPQVAQRGGWATALIILFIYFFFKKNLKIRNYNFFFQYIPLWFYIFHDVLHVVLISTRNGTLVL
jgi:hypothetical protein